MAIRTRDDPITILDICAGTGMLGTAVEIALETVGVDAATLGYVERDVCAAASIVARMEETTLRRAPIWSDVESIDVELWRGCVDIIVAGYPCQPFSQSGKRRGHRDPRHIWPDIRRAIKGIKPGIVYLENVSGHLSSGGGRVMRDLQKMGYDVTAGLFSSAETGGSHRRERLFILANAQGIDGRMGKSTRRFDAADTGRPGGDLGHSAGHGCSDTELRQPDEIATEGYSAVANAQCSDSRAGDASEQSKARCGRGGFADGGDDVANAHGSGLQGGRPRGQPDVVGRDIPRYALPRDLDLTATAEAISAAGSARQAGAVAVNAAGVARQIYGDWATVASVAPALMPAIESSVRGVVDGLVSRADRLRLIGNGVDPLVAAYAFLTLSACLFE